MDWIEVAAGNFHSIALKADGSLWSWGRNCDGQLGLGTNDCNLGAFAYPTRVGTDKDWALPSAPPARGEFRIVAQSLNQDHSRTLFFTHTNARAYYILHRGDSLTSITQPVDAALATAYPRLTDRTAPTNATAFYRIRAVPRTQPLDLDHDGIDDYYELRHAAFLHPLNPADAAQDPDGDGYSNLSEYRAGTDPARPTVRHSIASGLGHTVVLKQDGSLWAWGDNTHGQLGDGTYDSRAEPVRIGTDTDWISVSAGRDSQQGDHTVALKRDGTLWGWGANYWGQLGYPPDQMPGTNVPVRVGNSSVWVDVSAGGGYTAALQHNGSLWMWGNNNLDILPCCNTAWTPTRVGTDTDWATLSAGGTHILALKSDRSLWAWGDNGNGQCGLGEGVNVGNTPTRVGTDNDWIAIAASGDVDPLNGTHSLGLKADGTLWAWGFNLWGELGVGDREARYAPTRVGTDSDWMAIAAGCTDSLARKRDGSLWAWGANVGLLPSMVGTGRDWREFSVGGLENFVPANSPFGAAIKSDGSLYSWNIGPQVNPFPTMIGTDTDWTAIAAGVFYSLALKTNGNLWAWGNNVSGQLGNGTFNTTNTPQLVEPTMTWAAVAAGVDHSLGLRTDGTLWAWGYNSDGRLGNGTIATTNAPQLIQANGLWRSVSAGISHSVALRDDGTLWAWGGNGSGQLGNGTNNNTNRPQLIQSNLTWKAVSAGYHRTLALREEGTLWAWGNNYFGQLGNGSFNDTNTPQQIQTNLIWKAVSAGDSHTVALGESGVLWAWGGNNSGQLGNGTFYTEPPYGVSSPQPIETNVTWAVVSAGGAHTVALREDGTLWTWGLNFFGQLGDGTFKDSNVPHPIQPSMTWKAISAGDIHTLAIRADGTLWSWGDNSLGQLGISPDLALRRVSPDTDWGSPP